MTNDFKQIVNLQPKSGMQKDRLSSKRNIKFTKPGRKKNRIEEIDQIYNNENMNDKVKKELRQIDKPKKDGEQRDFFKQLSIIFFVIIIAMSAYFFIDNKRGKSAEDKIINSENQKGEWYSVQLVNKEVFYGFISDISADPIVLKKVYYNYNQISKPEAKDTEEKSGNIRLVKRGKESHGPDGSMNIIRSQVLYMEPLSEESKILQAILDYEK